MKQRKKQKTPKPKATKAEQIMYVETIYAMLQKGFVTNDILRYAAEKWDMSTRSGQEYLGRARAKMAEIVEEDMKHEYQLAVEQMKKDYYDAKERRDFKLASIIRKEINEVTGIKKFNLNITGEIGVKLSPEERKRKIAEYERKREKV